MAPACSQTLEVDTAESTQPKEARPMSQNAQVNSRADGAQ